MLDGSSYLFISTLLHPHFYDSWDAWHGRRSDSVKICIYVCHILIVIQVIVGPWGNLIIGLFLSFFLVCLLTHANTHTFYYFISFRFQYLINKYELDVWQAIYYSATHTNTQRSSLYRSFIAFYIFLLAWQARWSSSSSINEILLSL